MRCQELTFVLFFCSNALISFAQNKDTTATPKKNSLRKVTVDKQQENSAKSTADYPGIYKWSDYVQMYPCRHTTDNNNTDYYQAISNAITSDLKSEFYVQDVIPDDSSGDSDVIIRYLYYLKDTKAIFDGNISDSQTKNETDPKFKKVLYSQITNVPYFFRYNYDGTKDDFEQLKPDSVNSRKFQGKQKYFLVKLHIFKAYAQKLPNKVFTKGSVGLGVINYPFKYRLQSGGDFSGSFNVGAALAYTYRHDSLSKWSFSHILGFGISSITLDKSSVSKGADTLSSTNSFSALTFSYGFMVAYDKVQLGIFLGCDRISKLNNQTYGWKYQGNAWFSLGIGYSIFTTSSSSQQSKSDSQPNP